MRFTKIAPSPDLQPFVQNYWFLQVFEKDLPFSQHVLPFGWFDLFFHLEDIPQLSTSGEIQRTPSHSIFTGYGTKPSYLNYLKPGRCIGISFHAHAAKMLFNIPASHLADRLTDFDNLDPKSGLREQLFNADNDIEIISQVERYLSLKFKDKIADPISFAITKAIFLNPSENGYRGQVSSINLSRRRVEQRFLESVGVTMGDYLRTVRFEKALNMLCTNNKPLIHVALDAGYYDQSHFNHDFKEFTGSSPRSFLKLISALNEAQKSLVV